MRNAQLFATVDAQNAQLLELDAAKDDFLRGVSHNLQTPLTSIRAYADQLAAKRPDRRLEIIGEQADRLSRMVRQLLTVTRLESGALKPTAEVVALAPRVRRAWEALAAGDIEFSVDDRSDGWLAVADADQLDQVLWALLDNAVKYGRQAPIAVEIALGSTSRATGGDGVAGASRRRGVARRGSQPGRRGTAPSHDRGPRPGRRRGRSLQALRSIRPRQRAEGGGRERAGPVRLARALSGDGRRPRARTVGGGSRCRVQHLAAGQSGHEG